MKSDESKNVVDGMVKARQLYRSLAGKAHPDKHPDKRDIAEDIMSKLTSNKHNYLKLLEIKEEIEQKL